jgi:hypothetical protein
MCGCEFWGEGGLFTSVCLCVVDATIIAINLVNCYRYVWVWVLGEGGVVYMQVCGCTCCAFVMCFSSKEESATFWVMNRCVQSASQ